MDNENSEPRGPESGLAQFSDRVIAFCLDALPFVLGYWAFFDLAFRRDVTASGYMLYVSLWTSLFLIYQTFMSCEGRVSLGKRLLSIRIVDANDEPLDLGRAVMRSLTYLVSSVLSLGFLWSLFSKSRQCWHDMVVGSVVVCEREKSPLAVNLSRAGAFACMALLGAGYMWNNVWSHRYYHIRAVAFAQVGMHEMAQLQELHRLTKGTYAKDVFSLAKVAVKPRTFLRDMATIYDADYGVNIEATKDTYTIMARARDSRHTLVTRTSS